jgi:4,4'-diaponeurosporenoate glycosyltransferase
MRAVTAATVGLQLVGWLAGWAVGGRVHPLPGPADLGVPIPDRPCPRTTVVVPVRDEAARLPDLLAALSRDRAAGGQWELVVVDDESTDDSAAIAAAAGARVLAASPPRGWNGKAWACWLGARSAKGQVLVFLDADTRPEPGFVGYVATLAAAIGGMVSVQPCHYVERTYEQLSALANVVALMAGTGVVAPGARGWWRGPVGFGPAIAIPVEQYILAGGHRSARAAVAEDLALAAAVHAAGFPVAAYGPGGDTPGISYRMYPCGPRQLVEGWTKNLAEGARSVPPLRSALVATWVAGAASAAMGVGGALLGRSRPGYAVAGYALFAAQTSVLVRKAGRFHPATGLCYPLPLATFVVLCLRSALSRLTGRGTRWRGRWVAS